MQIEISAAELLWAWGSWCPYDAGDELHYPRRDPTFADLRGSTVPSAAQQDWLMEAVDRAVSRMTRIERGVLRDHYSKGHTMNRIAGRNGLLVRDVTRAVEDATARAEKLIEAELWANGAKIGREKRQAEKIPSLTQ
jgi:hypothetical protein